MCDADTVVLVKSALHSNAVLDDKQIHIVHACVLIEIKTDIVIMIQEIVQLRNIAVVLAMASEIDSHLDMNGIGIIGLTAGLIGKIFKESCIYPLYRVSDMVRSADAAAEAVQSQKSS